MQPTFRASSLQLFSKLSVLKTAARLGSPQVGCRAHCVFRGLVEVSGPRSQGLTGQQRRSNWHVLVSHSQFELVLSDTSGSYWSKCFTVPRQNVALLDTTAESLERGLFHGPVIGEHTTAALDIIQSAGLSCVHFGKDAAGSNRRLTAWKFSELDAKLPRTLLTDLECSLHCNDHIKNFVTKPFLDVIKQLYSVASLTSMGATFLKLLRFVPVAVDSLLVVQHVPVVFSENEEKFRSELLQYVKHNCMPKVVGVSHPNAGVRSLRSPG